MKLDYILEQLTYGELDNHSLTQSGSIEAKDYPKIISHLNAALTALHTAFPIRKETVHVQQYKEISTYFLTSEYAVSNAASLQPTKYIVDTAGDPFQDNILKIDGVKDENGADYYLNIGNECASLTTPIFNALNVPTPLDTNLMVIKYRSDHPRIVALNINVATTEIYIPAYLTKALTLFIGSRVYASRTSLEGVQVGNNMMNQYNEEIAKIEHYGMVNHEDFTNYKIEDDSWA